MAAPMPREAPVTSATRSLKRAVARMLAPREHHHRCHRLSMTVFPF